uniref:NAD(+) diphosphatase n=1 Tax=Neolamprologus brichardi TaxID=32507 RepID=A0A3Q4IBP2_NEOBR
VGLSGVRPQTPYRSVCPSENQVWRSSLICPFRYVNRLKEDDEACAAALKDGSIFLFHRLSPLLRRPDARTFSPAAFTCSGTEPERAALRTSEAVLIGCSEQNQAQFCLDVESHSSLCVLTPCVLTPCVLTLQGQALLRWHQTSRFCGASGQPTQRNRAGSQRFCSSSSTVYYPKMSAVAVALVSDGSRCLLGRQPTFPRGLYSALAGFCDMGETLEEALCREVAEEVGLEIQSISYSSSQHWPFPHSSFMLGCHALVSPLSVDNSELEDARWFTMDEITRALQVKAPPRRGDPPIIWLPPKHALANRLIREWVEQQRQSEGGE